MISTYIFFWNSGEEQLDIDLEGINLSDSEAINMDLKYIVYH